jgi:hypothetical protein
VRERAGRTAEVGYHDLIAALSHPGCPVCRGALDAARRHIDAFLWEQVNDAESRARVRSAHGFCREHAFLALEVAAEQGAGLGMALLYEDFLRHLRDDACGAVRGRRVTLFGAGRAAPELLDPHRPCVACETADRTADHFLVLLARADGGSEIGKAARQDERGLCIPHLRAGLCLASQPVEAERLLQIYLRGEAELLSDLDEYVHGRAGDEPLDARTASSWRRAVHIVVGEPISRRP